MTIREACIQLDMQMALNRCLIAEPLMTIELEALTDEQKTALEASLPMEPNNVE